MNDVQNFIDELKSISKINDPLNRLDEIDQLIKKYQAIIDENERENNEHNG